LACCEERRKNSLKHKRNGQPTGPPHNTLHPNPAQILHVCYLDVSSIEFKVFIIIESAIKYTLNPSIPK
jgi:hypothetical protein